MIRRETTLMGVIGLVLCATQVMGAAPLDRGHQILLEKGLQMQAMTSPYQPYNPSPNSVYWSAFANSNFIAPWRKSRVVRSRLNSALFMEIKRQASVLHRCSL